MAKDILLQGKTFPWQVEELGAALISTPALKIRIDEVSSVLSYYGFAQPGTAETEAKWRIFRLDTSAGLKIDWADGDDNFDNIWINRASLLYS